MAVPGPGTEERLRRGGGGPFGAGATTRSPVAGSELRRRRTAAFAARECGDGSGPADQEEWTEARRTVSKLGTLRGVCDRADIVEETEPRRTTGSL